MTNTVTVSRGKARDVVYLAWSMLPGREWGPYSIAEAKRDLQVSALLTAQEARDLIFDALAAGKSTREIAEDR